MKYCNIFYFYLFNIDRKKLIYIVLILVYCNGNRFLLIYRINIGLFGECIEYGRFEELFF